jgi:hypothetical protein
MGFRRTGMDNSSRKQRKVDRPNSVTVIFMCQIRIYHRVQKYQNAPQIIIKAGNTTATITVKGIEDFLNDEG